MYISHLNTRWRENIFLWSLWISLFPSVPLLKAMCKPTLVRNYFLVKYVGQDFLQVPIWKYTCEHILVKNHFFVKFVDQHFLEIPIWKFTCEPSLVRNHFLVKSVDQPFLTGLHLITTFKHILKQNFLSWKVYGLAFLFIYIGKWCHFFFFFFFFWSL